MTENWKRWPTDPRYIVSDLGRIKGLLGRILKPRPNPSGYMRIQVKSKDGYEDRYVHRMVCETYIGPAPKGYHADHKNKKRHDNRLQNLCWISPEENRATRAFQSGLSHWNAKLSPEQKKQIKLETGSNAKIARRFNVSKEHVRDIKNGRYDK